MSLKFRALPVVYVAQHISVVPQFTLSCLRQDPLHNMETYNSQDYIEYMNEFHAARRDSDDVADEENPPEGKQETP